MFVVDRTVNAFVLVVVCILACSFSAVNGAVTSGNKIDPWLRDPAISPNGNLIAFRFNGDIYIVSAQGGDARLVVGGKDHQRSPVWMPTSDKLVYASNASGNYDIYMVGIGQGSKPRLISSHGYDEIPLYVSANGKKLFYRSARADLSKNKYVYPPFRYWRGENLLEMDFSGGLPKVVLDPDIVHAVPAGNDRDIVFSARPGTENTFRKHERSPATLNVWLKDEDGFSSVASTDAHDTEPVWSKPERAVYLLSERNGTQNVWRHTLGGETKQITFHTRHPVRSLSVSDSGMLVYAMHGDIYKGKDTFEKLLIQLPEHSADQTVKLKKIRVSDRSVSQAVYAGGNNAVFTVEGAVFSAQRERLNINPLTFNDECISGDLSFSKDRQTLLVVCDSGNKNGLYKMELPAESSSWVDSTLTASRRWYDFGNKIIYKASLSPNGRQATVITSDALNLLDVESGQVRTLITRDEGFVDQRQNIAWHPNGKYIAISWSHSERAVSDVMVIRISDGSRYNITQSGFYESSPGWTQNGHVLTFKSNRDALRDFKGTVSSDLYALFFTPQAAAAYYNAEQQPIEMLDTDAFQKRLELTSHAVESGLEDVVRLTASNTSNAAMMASSKLEYAMWLRYNGDIWIKPLSGGGKAKIASMGSDQNASQDRHRTITETEKDGEVFIDGKGVVGWLDIKKGEFTPLDNTQSTVAMPMDRTKMHHWLFERAARSVSEGYYRPNYLGDINWNSYVDAYRPYVAGLSDPYDFAELMNELLGELNSSHTGFYYNNPAFNGINSTLLHVVFEETYGSLGVIYDTDYKGTGWRIAEVLPGSPLKRLVPEVSNGDVIRAISGEIIEKDDRQAKYFSAKADKWAALELEDNDGQRREVNVKLVDLRSEGKMLYRRWTARKEAEVKRLSAGKLAYAHMYNMGDTSFRAVVNAVLGRNPGAQGLVLDTRYNSGGWMHGPVLAFLSTPYAFTNSKFDVIHASEPLLRLGKPFNVLINAANISNGTETPAVIQKYKLAPLIGEAVAGTGLGGFNFTIPFAGYWGWFAFEASLSAQGEYLENQTIMPDISVSFDRTQYVKREDAQLEAAVRELLLRTADPLEK